MSAREQQPPPPTSDSKADFFEKRLSVNHDGLAQGARQRERAHDVRRETERYHRVPRHGLCRCHRARHDLAASVGAIERVPYDRALPCRDVVISLSGRSSARVQSLPEHQKWPSAQASTWSLPEL